MQDKDPGDHPLYQSRGSGQRPPRTTPPARQRTRRPPEDRPALVWLLLGLNIAIFLAGYLAPNLEWEFFARGAMIPTLVVQQGEVYRLFTAMFLHGSLGHLFFNMYALYIIGGRLEPIFGRARFLLVYLLGGLTGSALSLLLGALDGASVGASGAVFAIFAAQAWHLRQHRALYVQASHQLRHMAILIVINLVIGFLPGSRIDSLGHIGGMLGGALLAWRIGPRLSRPSQPPRSLRQLAQNDSNPLSARLPDLVVYAAALAGLVALAIVLRVA